MHAIHFPMFQLLPAQSPGHDAEAALLELPERYTLEEKCVLTFLSMPQGHLPQQPQEIQEYLCATNSFLNQTQLRTRSWVKVHILTQAQYFVCTASSAAKLPSRVKADLESHLPEIGQERTEEDEENESKATPTAGARDGSMTDEELDEQGSEVEVDEQGSEVESGLQEMDDVKGAWDVLTTVPELEFEHVVLDEAGAMLEPDMVGTIIHGCRFLLCVGDHRQARPSPCSYIPAAASAAICDLRR